MNRDDIVRMAREAGFESNSLGMTYTSGSLSNLLERFANLVAAAEREACAKVADDGRFLHDDSPEAKFGKACAAAIRARGKHD
jgi:spore coat polysaccharide biosynthesis protein SpsF (cytidylyltransferase family)